LRERHGQPASADGLAARIEARTHRASQAMTDSVDPSLPPGDATPERAPAAPSAKASPAPADPGAAPRGARARTTSRLLVGIVAVAAIAAVFAVWLDGRRSEQALRKEVAQRLSAIEATTGAAANAQTQLASDLRDALAKIALLEARVAESQSQQASLEALYRDLAPSRDEIALTEIEQVLLVASQQLLLAGNVQSALAALQLADARLQRLDRPQFLPLRRALSRDIDRLKAMPFVDIAGMSLKLDQALAAVDALPLAMDERIPPPSPAAGKGAPAAAGKPGAAPGAKAGAKSAAAAPPAGEAPPAEEPTWRRIAREAWAEIRQLVRVEVSDRPAAPLLMPSQQYFLRENLKLRLLSARVALLNRDDASFKSDVGAAETWLRLYFDTRAKPVQAMQATLKQLAATPMGSEMPDLGGSLEALRVLRLAQERTPVRVPERAAPAPRPAR
jgi:uroporphyrin-3 C-methyltransferase